MAHIVTRTGIGKPVPAAPLFLDVAGPVNFDSYLTVIGDVTVNGLLSIQRPSNIESLEFRAPLDAEPQFSISRDGSISWGAGGAVPVDSNLYRESALVLRTNSSFTVDVNLLVSGDGTVVGDLYVQGDTFLGNDFLIDTVSFNSKIATDFVPVTDNSVDLGAVGFGWKDLYISRNAVFGTSPVDSVIFNSYVSSSFIPTADAASSLGLLANRWDSLFLASDLRNDGSTILGTTGSDSLAVNSTITTSLLPQTTNLHDLGSPSLKWASLYLGTDLNVDGNSVFGIDSSDAVTFNASISSAVIPSSDNVYDLGTSLRRWGSLYLGNSVEVDGPAIFNGDVTLGDNSSDTIVFNGLIASSFVPELDNTFDLGTTALRWQTLHVGPGSVIVHNDDTDTNKVTLGFDTGTAVLRSDAATELRLTNGINRGILIDIAGFVGVNTISSLVYQFEVEGTVGASDTIHGMKATGVSIYSESNVVVKGSIEAESASKNLNIGTTADTEFINIGTGLGLQTLNIGTGAGPTVINIGSSGDTINFQGTANYFQTINSSVLDKSFVLNAGGANATTPESGIFVEEASVTQLSVDDALWQAGNVVRYNMTDTGNIQAGNSVTVTGFLNSVNNGTFNVVSVSAGSYVDLNNPGRNSSAEDETGASAFVTNPTLPASIKLSADASAWELRSTVSPSNVFSLKNSGGDVQFEAVSTALIVTAPAGIVRPLANGNDLGTTAFRWDVFGEDLNVNTATVNTSLQVDGNTILGDTNADTLVVNAVSSFIGRIATSLIPDIGTVDLGTSSNRWRDLWLSGSVDIDGSADIALNLDVGGDLAVLGNTTLGDSPTDTVSFVALIASDLIPNAASTFDLGGITAPWQSVYSNNVYALSLPAGGVVYASLYGLLSSDATNFHWDDSNFFLGLGTGTPEVRLHLADPLLGVGAKLVNNDTSTGLGLFGDSVSRIQYSGTSLVLSSVSHANLGTNSAGTPNLSLISSGLSLFGGGVGYSLGAAVASNSYAVTALDTVVRVDSSSPSITANCTITLPSALTARLLFIKDIGNNCSTLNKNIVLTPASGESIEFGAANATYTMDLDGMSLTLHSDGVSGWYII